MKINILILAGTVAAAAASHAIADEDDFGSGLKVVRLNATTNAPAGASGLATLSADVRATQDCFQNSQSNALILRVATEGLLAGTYSVIVNDTSTNSYNLGTFNVTAFTNPVPVETSLHGWPFPVNLGSIGGGSFSLPAGLNRTNLAGVSVSDTNGLPDLTGTFQGPPPPPPSGLVDEATLTPTTNAPATASGLAQLFWGPCFEPRRDCLNPIAVFAPFIRVTTDGLSNGTFSVSITDVNTNTYVLGTFQILPIVNPTAERDRWTGVNPPAPMIIPVGGGIFTLPSGLSPTNVVGISVSDTNGVEYLTGMFQAPPPPPRVIREFLILAATTNAPAKSMGRAAMEGEISGSTNTVQVKVETIGLLSGTYTTTLTDTTGTNTYTLGSFSAGVVSNCVTKSGLIVFPFRTNTVGGASFPLPAGLDPTNAGTIDISDTNGLVDLTGSFTNAFSPVPCVYDTTISLIPGPLCTNLLGSARLHVQVTKSKSTGRLALIATGAPAKATLNLFVNGAQVGTVKSDRHGRLNIVKLPKGTDFVGVSTLAVEDAAGQVVFTASF